MTPKLHICTVATEERKTLTQLMTSCKKNGAALTILGMGTPFRGFCEKFVCMQEHIENLPDTDVVLFVDAYDTLILAPPDVILETFLEMRVPFVISVERNCWPDARLKEKYGPSPTSFRYINSGTYIGYVHHLKKIFHGLSPIDPKDNDQTLMTVDYLQHPETYTPDSFCQIFFPSCDVKSWEVAVDRKNRTLLNLETNTKALVLHGNGYSPWYQYVYDSLFSDTFSQYRSPLQSQEDKTVFLAVFAKNYGDIIEKYLTTIDELMYDKKLITIYINASMSTDNTQEILTRWVQKRQHAYAHIIVQGDTAEVVTSGWDKNRFNIPQTLRKKSMQLALEHKADFYFALDCHSFVTPFTLKELVNKNKPIIAPMLRNIPEVFDTLSTFSTGRSKEADLEVYEHKRVGTCAAKQVHATFLIQKEVLKALVDTMGEKDTISSCALKAGISQFVTNEKDFGVMLYFSKALADDAQARLDAFLSCAMMWS